MKIGTIVAIAILVASIAPVTTANATYGYSQGFETDISGWDSFGPPFDAIRVASGTNGIPSSSGNFHAESEPTDGAAGDLGGYECDCFPTLGYTVSVDIYLDFTLADGSDRRFDYTVAINGSDPECLHLSDFVFSVGTRPGIVNEWIASVSQNCPGWPSNPGRPNQPLVDGTGWYTFRHAFTDSSGFLDVDMEIYNPSNSQVASLDVSTLYDGDNDLQYDDPIPTSAVSGHRYAWFCGRADGSGYMGVPVLAFDNSSVTGLPCGPTAIEATTWGRVKGLYR